MKKHKKAPRPSVISFRDFLSGFCAGTAQILVGQPLDLIKTYVQMAGRKIGAKQLAQTVWQKAGLNIFAYYKGASTMFIGNGLTVSVELGLNETFHHMFMKYVNKDGKELIPKYQIAISGALVGFVVSFVYTPIEFCKIQMQMKTPEYAHYKGATEIFWDKLKHGQIKTIYKGAVSTMLREVIGCFAYFSAYQNYIRMGLAPGANSHAHSSVKDILIAGSLAGLAFWLVVYPLDAIKTQVQSGMAKTYKQSAQFLWKNNLMFRGLSIALVRSVPVNAVSFLTFEKIEKEMKDRGY